MRLSNNCNKRDKQCPDCGDEFSVLHLFHPVRPAVKEDLSEYGLIRPNFPSFFHGVIHLCKSILHASLLRWKMR